MDNKKVIKKKCTICKSDLNIYDECDNDKCIAY